MSNHRPGEPYFLHQCSVDPLLVGALALLSTVGIGVVTNALYDLIKQVLTTKGEHTQTQIVKIDRPDGSHILGVTIDEQYDDLLEGNGKRQMHVTLIRIREQPRGQVGSNALLSFEHGAEYPVSIHDPFSEEEEQQLEWYFEQWLRFPFLNQVKAQTAAEIIPTYGEKLFTQVFADPEAHAAYRAATQLGLSRLQFEIAGSPTFHRWHWEALKDPKLPHPLALQASMVRKNLTPQVMQARVNPSPTINLLVIVARPGGAQDVGYRTISRPLVEALRQTGLPVRIDIVRPGTFRALVNHLEEVQSRQHEQGATGGYYHVIHFDVHGALLPYETYQQLQQQYVGDRILLEKPYGHQPLAAYDGRKAFLFLESGQETTADPVEAQQLADVLLHYQIPIAILNACQSGKQIGSSETSLGSRLMQAGVQMVLAMGYSVTVSAAELLMRTLYLQLFDGHELSTAIRRARLELYNHKERRAYFNQTIELEDWLLPVVYQNRAQRLTMRAFTPEESKRYFEGQAARYSPPQPSYGFIGRDLDILQIEQRLLAKHNLLLVRGMGGAGKTSLLQHLGTWWQSTGLVEQVCYFGYDEQAWTGQQILHTLAKKLFDPVQYVRDFQPLSLQAQQAMLAQRLRAHRHLLILDNLESITGAKLSIQHTLPPAEQARLQCLLADLVGGRTLVLLGSRGAEDWLSNETFADNIYDLSGLDPEVASILAELILERHGATRYRQDPALRQLLKLLDGFPLALEVVLSNLARQTPQEVLAALQAGDVSLDTGDAQKKTESILRCIDFAHSNLSTEIQQLLLCLAPFTSVLYQPLLEAYTQFLRQQPLLATLPFERWAEVVDEAKHWGLLSPHQDLLDFLHLQPTLPYFLRNRLHAPELAERLRAINMAFHEVYDQWGEQLASLQQSKDPQERQLGQVFTELEYENLTTAIHLALELQVSSIPPYNALARYLNARHDYSRALALYQSIVERMEAYPPEQLAGPLGYDLALRINALGTKYLQLKQYTEAIDMYQKTLQVVLQVPHVKQQSLDELRARSYHGLGRVAQEQRQWQQAEQYYQRALQLYSEYNDRYNQAPIYHQLGRVAQEQREFQQAEQYYQQALQLFIEYNDRYSQAPIYHNLGRVAKEQRQWQQAKDFFLHALEICVAAEDNYNRSIVLHSLARLWQASGDVNLPTIIAPLLNSTSSASEEVLRSMLEKKPDEPNNELPTEG
jgi:tetratricopeptide (TPR) repeat protein